MSVLFLVLYINDILIANHYKVQIKSLTEKLIYDFE